MSARNIEPLLEAEIVAFERVHNLSEGRFRQVLHEVAHALHENPNFPSSGIVLMKSRFKKLSRLVEKVEDLRAAGVPVDIGNYTNHVHDIAGIRYVTLTRRDRRAVLEYIEMTAEAGALEIDNIKVMDGFSQLDFDKPYPERAEIAFNDRGYTSVHCLVRVADWAERVESRSSSPVVEIQIRTILEEAWSEVDHRYRYELTRVGIEPPLSVRTGFTDLSAMLQAVAQLQENLCEQAADAEAREQVDEHNSRAVSEAGLDQPTIAARLYNQVSNLVGGVQLTPGELLQIARFNAEPAGVKLETLLARLSSDWSSFDSLLARHRIAIDRVFDQIEAHALFRYVVVSESIGTAEAERSALQTLREGLAR